MPPKAKEKGKGKATATDKDNSTTRPTKVLAPTRTNKRQLEASRLLPFQRNILAQLVPPPDAPPNTNDALLIVARGLGLRTIITTFVSPLSSERCGGEIAQLLCRYPRSSKSTTCPRSWYW